MGYTHYWKNTDFAQSEWEKIAADAIEICDYCEGCGIKLTSDYGLPEQAKIDDKQIRFNGVGSESYETFILSKYKRDINFNACKTARKPYDLAVGLVLLRAKKHAPNSIFIASDGGWYECWGEIKKMHKDLFLEDAKRPFITPEEVQIFELADDVLA